MRHNTIRRRFVTTEEVEIPEDHEACYSCKGKGYYTPREQGILCTLGEASDETCYHCHGQGYVSSLMADIWLGRGEHARS